MKQHSCYLTVKKQMICYKSTYLWRDNKPHLDDTSNHHQCNICTGVSPQALLQLYRIPPGYRHKPNKPYVVINKKYLVLNVKKYLTPTVNSQSTQRSLKRFVGQPFYKWNFSSPAVETACNRNFFTITSPSKYSWILADRLRGYWYLHCFDFLLVT